MVVGSQAFCHRVSKQSSLTQKSMIVHIGRFCCFPLLSFTVLSFCYLNKHLPNLFLESALEELITTCHSCEAKREKKKMLISCRTLYLFYPPEKSVNDIEISACLHTGENEKL